VGSRRDDEVLLAPVNASPPECGPFGAFLVGNAAPGGAGRAGTVQRWGGDQDGAALLGRGSREGFTIEIIDLTLQIFYLPYTLSTTPNLKLFFTAFRTLHTWRWTL